MRALSLFTGIGGLDIAAMAQGIEPVAMVERDPFCQQILALRFPGVRIYDDIHDITAEGLAHDGILPIDIIYGGFPCQPISAAGRQAGKQDDRYLWPEMARAIRAVRPRWVVAENVRNLLAVGGGAIMGDVLRDLANLGYRVGWGVWGAADVGAPHKRERVFLVGRLADARSAGREERHIPAVAGPPTFASPGECREALAHDSRHGRGERRPEHAGLEGRLDAAQCRGALGSGLAHPTSAGWRPAG